MTPLATKLIFIASSTLGAATLGSTAYLVEHPRVFTPAPVRPLSVAPLSPRPLPPAPVLVPESMEMPAVTLSVKAKPSISRAKASPTVEAKALAPCSDWRDMGPTNVNKNGTSGVHRVRGLCP
jgi:hypothetical protein